MRAHLMNGWKKVTKKEILEDLYERWQSETNGNAVFISALEKRNLDTLEEDDHG